jgi:DNA-binding response OmpR family regulator
VTLRFPRADAVREEEQTLVAAGQSTTGVATPAHESADLPLHVLIVEDDDAGREFLRRILRTEGYRVDAAANCEEARERLAVASESPYHVMLTDVSLPDGSGWELAAYARQCAPALRIGVITGWEEQTRKPESGDVEFVMRKPLRAAELLALIASRTTSTTIG